MGMIGNTLAQGLISGANIQDGTVDTADIKSNAITPSKLSIGGLTWDTSGNVGIGTANPAQRLHLAQAGQPRIEFEDTTNSSKGRITTGGTTGSMTFDADPDNTKAGTVMTFNVDGSERARIDANGNLAVGTTTISSSSTDVLTIGKNSNANDVNVVIRQFGANTAARMQLIAADDSGAAYNNIASSTSGGTQHWRLGGVGGFTGGLAIFTSGSERARIDSSGRLGVGASSNLSARLTVNGRIDIGANWGTDGSTLHLENDATASNGAQIRVSYWGGGPYGPLRFNVGGSERARIDSSGNFTVNGSHVMRFRGGMDWANVNSFVGSSYDGYWQITFSGHSGWLFSQNSGGSAGTIQMYSTYFDGPWYRSNTDNSSWTAWRQL